MSEEVSRVVGEHPVALWREAVGRVRADSAAARLLDALPSMSVLSAEEAENVFRVAPSALYRGLERLVEARVLLR